MVLIVLFKKFYFLLSKILEFYLFGKKKDCTFAKVLRFIWLNIQQHFIFITFLAPLRDVRGNKNLLLLKKSQKRNLGLFFCFKIYE
jgi:hypothetical protein